MVSGEIYLRYFSVSCELALLEPSLTVGDSFIFHVPLGEHPKLLQGPTFPHAGALGHDLIPVQITGTCCLDVFSEQLFAGWQLSEQQWVCQFNARFHQFCPGCSCVLPGVVV